MSKFSWCDEYNVDGGLIDNQHQHLFALANQVFESDNPAIIITCIMELFGYIRKHFKDEEKCMKQISYPLYEEHARAHDQILLKLEEISVNMRNNDFNTEQLNELMAEWILTHILKEDILIGQYLRMTAQDSMSS